MPGSVEGVGGTGLAGQSVGESDRPVAPVAHPGCLIAEGHAVCFEEGCVGRPESVPAHARPVEVSHRGGEGDTGFGVVPPDWWLESCEKHGRAWTEWYYPLASLGLRRVDPTCPISCASDPEDMALYVAWLYSDCFSPAQPGEQDQLGHEVPRRRQSLDDALDVWEREHVAAGGVAWNPRASWRQGQVADDAAALGVAQAGGEDGIDAPDGCGRCSGVHEHEGEAGQVLGPQAGDGDVAEGGTDVDGSATVAGEGVVASPGSLLLGFEPGIDSLGDSLERFVEFVSEHPLGNNFVIPDVLIDVPPADPAADQPGA